MRSSKSRSRGNKNRPTRPTGGNIINRVFDSSGPDGKVRGTPQQIVEKYTQLHRDAQLSNDRVSAENFAQHAEHYTRMLAEAMREVERVREEQEQQNRERQAERDRQMNADRQAQAERGERHQHDRGQDRDRQDRDRQDRDRQDRGFADRQADRERQSERDRERVQRLRAQEALAADPSLMEQPDVILPVDALGADAPQAPDSGLVETPEGAATVEPVAQRPARRERQPRKSAEKPASPTIAEGEVAQDSPQAAPETVPEVAPDAAPEPAPKRAPRARKPRSVAQPSATADTPEAAE